MMVESKQELTLMSPFGGYVHHEPKDITYEFHPYYGYVPKLKESSENEDQEKEEKLYKHPSYMQLCDETPTTLWQDSHKMSSSSLCSHNRTQNACIYAHL